MQSSEIIQNIKQIYDDYSIPANLRRHMIWVANVAELLCDNCKEKVNKEDIIAACLIHDLANLIKMNFELHTGVDLLDKEDQEKLDFYKQRQDKMKLKFGLNAEHANPIIAKELGASERVIELVSHKPFEICGDKLLSNDVEEVIAAYADLRVEPKGIVSMKERMEDFDKRYNTHLHKEKIEFSTKFKPLAEKMEKELFEKIKIKPEEITSKTTKKYFEKYKEAI